MKHNAEGGCTGITWKATEAHVTAPLNNGIRHTMKGNEEKWRVFEKSRKEEAFGNVGCLVLWL